MTSRVTRGAGARLHRARARWWLRPRIPRDWRSKELIAWRGFKTQGKTFLSHFERTALLNGTVEAIGEENTGGIRISDLNVGVSMFVLLLVNWIAPRFAKTDKCPQAGALRWA
jgi:hypothetical protein